MSNIAAIVMTECLSAAKGKVTLDEIIDACFGVAKNHWLTIDENGQYLGAIGAILQLSSDEDEARMRAELDVVKALNAAMSGVPVDMSALPEPPENPVCLQKRWKAHND